MPSLVLISAPEGAQSRLRSEVLEEYKKKGYALDRRLESASWQDLFEDALRPSLFCPLRIFEVDDGKSLGPLPERFQKDIEQGDAPVILLLHTEKSMAKELGTAAKRCRVVAADPVPRWPSQRVVWLQKLAGGRGLKLDRGAASLLADWIEDGEELRGELAKLGQAAAGGRITEELVRSLSFDEGGKGMLNLLAAMEKADVALMVESLRSLRAEGELIPVLAAVHKRVRAAFMASALGSDGLDALKLTAYQTKTARSMAGLYGRELLALWLGETIRLSWSERNGEGAGWNGLENLLLAVFSRADGRSF